MIIRIICSREELERIDEIQDKFNIVMNELSESNFKGTMTIEEEVQG